MGDLALNRHKVNAFPRVGGGERDMDAAMVSTLTIQDIIPTSSPALTSIDNTNTNINPRPTKKTLFQSPTSATPQ